MKTKYKVGQRVWWTDPDEGLCSDQYTIQDVPEVEGGSYYLVNDKGSHVEAPARELNRNTPNPNYGMIEVSYAVAQALYKHTSREVFRLFDDGTEALIESDEHVRDSKQRYGIEGPLFWAIRTS